MRYLLLFILILSTNIAFAQQEDTIDRNQYTTQRISGAIKFDGIPNEAVWDSVPWSGDFIEHEPDENADPSVQTHFKVLYDDKFLYLAYQALDPEPDKIVRRMGRRDEFPGDWVEINIDSYHDLRTAFSFTLSVSGVRGDEFVSNNGNNWDGNWNPIWYGKTHIDSSGWTAEVKIPFSQLRFGNEKEKVWGLQVQRRLFRQEERSVWQPIPKAGNGWVSYFGELHGLNNIPAQKQIEIAPYIVAQHDAYRSEPGNPFATGSDNKVSAGLDGKIALTSDLILDFTINPDFGQVEADPSQVRIDGFQSFFGERRPFFIESRNIFDYQITGSSAGGDYDADLLFYSRRIGSAPHGFPSLSSGAWCDIPDNTSILGAAKFSGKTKDNWSIGILESVTQREHAEIDLNGERSEQLVEPLTSYFVGRLQKDLTDGNTVIGGIFTAVNRENGLENFLHRSAYSGGIDFQHFWNHKNWYYKGDFVMSNVSGTPEAIYNTQTSFEHLFQRGGITEAHVDTTLTSLTGTGGTFKIGKAGGNYNRYGGVLQFETGVTWRSPELEMNDIGFMLTADEINHFAWAGMMFQKPFSIFRNGRISYNHWLRWDFGGQFLYAAVNANTHATFRNFWSTGIGATWNPVEISNNALRGYAALRKPPGMGMFWYLNSDSRKKVSFNFEVNKAWGFDQTVSYDNVGLDINTQPLDALNISLGIGYNKNSRKQDQFVDQQYYQGTVRTIVGHVEQQTWSMVLRASYNITPDLTIQYYGQPFITRPLFNHFGYVTDPLNNTYDARFHVYDSDQIMNNGDSYSVDEDKDGTVDYTFGHPDFNFVQFRSNLVLRWEYRPGSEFYLVWSQGNTPNVANDLSTPLGRSLFDNAFDGGARNIALLKFTYRFLK